MADGKGPRVYEGEKEAKTTKRCNHHRCPFSKVPVANVLYGQTHTSFIHEYVPRYLGRYVLRYLNR